MESWLVLYKFFVLIYCCIKYIQYGMEKVPYIILAVLIHISLNMFYHILRTYRCRFIFLVVSAVLLIISGIFLNEYFLMLLPFNILELWMNLSDNIKFSAAVTLSGVIFAPMGMLPEYILLYLLGTLLYIISSEYDKTKMKTSEENDNLRAELDTLYMQINRNEEYQRQMMHLSQLEERNFIAQKIHDSTGHTIAGALIQLEAAALLIERDGKKAQGIIKNVTSILREGMENIRRTLRNIKPPSEQLGISKMKTVLNEFSLKHDVKTEFSYNGNIDKISFIQWKIIYENLIEALTNSLKYSQCTIINVTLQVFHKVVKFEVKDNGHGAAALNKGMGLKGIEERCANIGGKVIIDGSKGFSIITLLPMEN